MATTITSSAWAIRQAWRHARGLFVVLILVQALLAVGPAAQVVAVGWLVGSADGSITQFLGPLLVLAILVGIGQVCGEAAVLMGQRLRQRLMRHFQRDLLSAVSGLPPRRLAEPATSATIAMARSSLFELGELVGSVLSAAGAVVAAVVLCVAVWTMSPLAAILLVLALVPSLVLSVWVARVRERSLVEQGSERRRAQYAAEQLVTQRSGMELASLGSGQVVAAIADRHHRRAVRIEDRLLRLIERGDALGGAGMAVLLAGAMLAILSDGAGGVGVAAGVVGVLAGLDATRWAGFAFGDIVTHTPKVAAFRRFVDSVPTGGPSLAPVPSVDAVAVEDVTFHYAPTAAPALHEVSFSAGRGDMVALVGINGAGKTTAVNILLGLLTPDLGTVTVNGAPADGMDLADRLRLFGPLTQEFGRYEFTVRDTVRIGRVGGEASDDEIWSALEAAQADGLVRDLPHGLDTQLGEQFGGVGLSGGQWQRLALARIQLRDAPVWVLDEPTSAIDAQAEQSVFTALGRSRADRITLVVSHRAWTLRGMDRIHVFDGGRIVESGTFTELVGRGGRFAELFAQQLA